MNSSQKHSIRYMYSHDSRKTKFNFNKIADVNVYRGMHQIESYYISREEKKKYDLKFEFKKK